jgi:HEAT repeat protein
MLREGRFVHANGPGVEPRGPVESAELRSTLDALFDPEPERREHALDRLKSLYVHCDDRGCSTSAEVAAEALPYAARALASPNTGVRVTGARALGLLAADGLEGLGALAGAFDDDVTEVRIAALEAMSEFGRAAAPFARQAAARLSAGSTAEERAAAAYILSNTAAGADHADALIEALLRDEPGVQAAAAAAIAAALEAASSGPRERLSLALHAVGRR